MANEKDKDERTYLVTDCCMWERNKKNGTYYPHAMEVVDIETGQTCFIRSGSKIRFIEGFISDFRTQEAYNAQKESKQKVSGERKGRLRRIRSKGSCSKNND